MIRPRILVVDDKPNILHMFDAILGNEYAVVTAPEGNRAIALAGATEFDVVVADIRMPGVDGFEVLRELKRLQPDAEVILMTAYGSVQSAVEAIKTGAYDYLPKPFEPEDAVIRIGRAAERKRLRVQARDLKAALAKVHDFEGLVGRSPAMNRVFEALRGAANRQEPVLISGEGGTGKRLAARAVHLASISAAAAFVELDCTRFRSDRRGPSSVRIASLVDSFENADRGTLFVREISDLPPEQQQELLTLLERGRARVIASTSAEPRTAAARGLLRDDLLARMSVMHVHLPPLRTRTDDIPLLAARFLEQSAAAYGVGIEGFAPDALLALMGYAWPGNVDELKDAVERAVAVIDAPLVPLEALPEAVRAGTCGASLAPSSVELSLKDALELARDRASREYLIALMRHFGGNVTRAAERAGIERESLHRLLKRYGLRSSEFKGD